VQRVRYPLPTIPEYKSLKRGKSGSKRLLEATDRKESRFLHKQKRPQNSEIVAIHPVGVVWQNACSCFMGADNYLPQEYHKADQVARVSLEFCYFEEKWVGWIVSV
jgi:hypothetical protein